MILFVDGVDGSGKSTLIDGLLDHLATSAQVVLAPPLWTFLPLASADDFAPWVRRTPGVEVGRQLLAAMCRQVDNLRTDLAQGSTPPDALILADRGPKTVACSANAHTSTGLGRGPSPPPTGPSLPECIAALEGRIACLAAATTLAAVELQHGTIELLLNRLAPLENLSPQYEHYLRAFANEMTTTPAWRGIPTLPLPANAAPAANIAAAAEWAESMSEHT